MKLRQKIKSAFLVILTFFSIFLIMAALNAPISGSVVRAQTPTDPQQQPGTTELPYGGRGSVTGLAGIFRDGFVPCGHKDDPDGKRPDDTCTIEDAFILIARVTNFMIAFAGIFVVYRFVDGAFGLVTANGNQQGISAGKEKLVNAFYGLMLVMMAYLLVTTILYFLLQFNGPKDILSNPKNYITGSGSSQ